MYFYYLNQLAKRDAELNSYNQDYYKKEITNGYNKGIIEGINEGIKLANELYYKK